MILQTEAAISERAEEAEEHVRGAPSDAVVWEGVAARTSERTELSGAFGGTATLGVQRALYLRRRRRHRRDPRA